MDRILSVGIVYKAWLLIRVDSLSQDKLIVMFQLNSGLGTTVLVELILAIVHMI